MHVNEIGSTALELTKTGAEKARVMPPGTVFVLTRGMMLLRDIPISISTVPSAFNQDVKAFSTRDSITPEYLLLMLESAKTRLLRGVSIAGNGTGRLETSTILDLTIPLPSINEQKRLTSVVDSWRTAVDMSVAELDLASARRAWLCESVIVGSSQHTKRSSSWQSQRLSDLLTERTERSYGDEEVFSVSVNEGLVNQVAHLGRSFAAASTAHYRRVHPGDLVYTRSPTGRFPLGILKKSRAETTVIVSPLYGVFTPQSREIGTLLDAAFESPKTSVDYLSPLAQRGAKNTIALSNARFLEGRISLPMGKNEARLISDILDASRREILLLRRRVDLLSLQSQIVRSKLIEGLISRDGSARPAGQHG
jgi:type I restriction enzyme S subunit